MIEVVVVDASAESRSRLAERVSNFQKQAATQQSVVPQLSLKPVSLQELKFIASPDICIVGAECLSRDLVELAAIRKTLPKTKIIAEIGAGLGSLIIAEQMARLGVDDTLCDDTSAADFMRKLILLMRRTESAKQGKMILVDSGKGGTGVTSIVSALSEACLEAGKKVIAIDLDFETQDLSRFLQTRPFINENLQALLQQERPVVNETVEQCLVPVWEDEARFFCVPPVAELPELYDVRSNTLRIFLSFFEALDRMSDVVIVDMGAARGALRQALYRVADTVLFTVNNDPATLYAAVHRIASALSVMGDPKDLIVVENAPQKHGLPGKFLREELRRAARIEPANWFSVEIPLCKSGARWPASGSTLFGQAKKPLQESVRKLAAHIGLVPVIEAKMPKTLGSLIERVKAPRILLTSQPPLHTEPQKTLGHIAALPAPSMLVSEATTIQKVSAPMDSQLITESKIVQV